MVFERRLEATKTFEDLEDLALRIAVRDVRVLPSYSRLLLDRPLGSFLRLRAHQMLLCGNFSDTEPEAFSTDLWAHFGDLWG